MYSQYHADACALAMIARRRPTGILSMDSTDSRSPRPGWLRLLGGRVAIFWPAKMIGTTVGMTVFFVVYFWILQHPLRPPVIMPLTAVDRWIGFWPGALPLYFSLWIYVSLAPALLTERRELLAFGVAAVVLSVVGLGIFFIWPTAVPPPAVEWARYPAFAFLKSVDASGNACPSLHVAFAVFSAAWFGHVFRRLNLATSLRMFNWLWCAGIMYSTVATRQHVSLDVFAGALLGGGIAAANLAWLNSRRPKQT